MRVLKVIRVIGVIRVPNVSGLSFFLALSLSLLRALAAALVCAIVLLFCVTGVASCVWCARLHSFFALHAPWSVCVCVLCSCS